MGTLLKLFRNLQVSLFSPIARLCLPALIVTATQAGATILSDVSSETYRVQEQNSLPSMTVSVSEVQQSQSTTQQVNLNQLIRVGPERIYRLPSDAAKIAQDGDTVEIDAGEYLGDVAIWRQSNLTLRGVGGRAHIKAEGKNAEGKGIWVVKGNNVKIENLEFSGAEVPDRNGAGIRYEGSNLTIRDSSFHHNEMGLLTGNNKWESTITIETSEFYDNFVDYKKFGKLGHNIYIGSTKKFVLRGSYIRGAIDAHNVKTRAQENLISNNRIMDERDGASSYLLQFANGGIAYVVGNIFQQSESAPNWHMISYGAEGLKYDNNALYIVNNTFENSKKEGVFVRNASDVPARIVNNYFIGPGDIATGPADLSNNLSKAPESWLQKNLSKIAPNLMSENTDTPLIVDRENFDYRLLRGSPAIDQGIDPGSVNGFNLMPVEEYLHPLQTVPRAKRGPIDIGAHEFSGD